MELEIGLKFVYSEHRKMLCLADFKSDISCGNYQFLFDLARVSKATHALKVLNDEFESAIARANERLLADGFGEESFCESSIEKNGIEVVK